jgi:hypothetical protein
LGRRAFFNGAPLLWSRIKRGEQASGQRLRALAFADKYSARSKFYDELQDRWLQLPPRFAPIAIVASLQNRIANPYDRCVRWMKARPRTALSPQQRSDARRIVHLGEGWGRRLDSLGATYQQVRWAAGPGHHRLAEVERRVRALEGLLGKPGGATFREWRALQQSWPRTDRARTATPVEMLRPNVVRVRVAVPAAA